MTPRRRDPADALRCRVCFFCNTPLTDTRPVFLVQTASGRIVGPYHAGCAERVSLAAQKHAEDREPNGKQYGRALLPMQQGELPW